MYYIAFVKYLITRLYNRKLMNSNFNLTLKITNDPVILYILSEFWQEINVNM